MKVEKEHKGVLTFISSEYRNLILYVKKYLNERYYDVSAEDIIQDISVNIFDKLDFDEHVENIAGYVYRAIRNKITDFQRKSKKEIPFENFVDEKGNDKISENIQDKSDIFFREIDDERFYDIFYKALDKLSPNQQMVFVATEIDGYTFDELSDELNIPIGTLLSWKHRGVKKLKELIKLDDFYKEY